ncbi:MAG: C26 family cysteine hydrolase domain-containing family [Lachnospiraceae bacterium]|nr:C26 family cysteine hydrolase domain-containing family [Lachnospiraceae bacterium]
MKTTPKFLIAGLPEKTRNYEEALKGAGVDIAIGFMAENASEGNIPTSSIRQFNALLLPGGADIDPALFHQPPKGAKNIDRTVDLRQLQTLDAFVKAGKPVLGICKGMQIINIYFGGTLIQHIRTAAIHQSDQGDLIHQTWTAKNSFLHEVYGSRFITNSAHHQAVGRLGRGLHIIQETTDHVPEALIHDSLPIIAVQWHPERMCMTHSRSDTVDGMKLFDAFIQKLS